jgi:AmmeMemoRadiSam system protein B
VAAAGRGGRVFYPAEPARLAADVDALLSTAAPEPVPAARLPALDVPHGGYRCSGQVAAVAYALARRWSPARASCSVRPTSSR